MSILKKIQMPVKLVLAALIPVIAGVQTIAGTEKEVRVPVNFAEAVAIRAYPDSESGSDFDEFFDMDREILKPEKGFVKIRAGGDPVWIAEGVPGRARSAGESPFGFHPASVRTPDGEDYSYAKEIGAKWDRGGLYLMWIFGQPELDSREYSWDMFDSYFQNLPDWMFTLKNICPVQGAMVDTKGPRRPHRPGFNPQAYIAGGGYAPSDEKAYSDWVSAVVERYDGDGKDDMPGLRHKVRYWQVDNEPRAERGDYARLVRVTSRAVKKADPSAKVLLSGFWKLPFGKELESYRRVVTPALKELGGRDMDIFDIHWYGNPGEWKVLPGVLKMLRSDLTAAGFKGTPVWITEMGVYSGCPQRLPCRSEREQASELVKHHVTAFGNGVRKIFWAWSIMNNSNIGPGYFNHTGLIYNGEEEDSPGEGARKLGFWAYRTMTSLLRGWDGRPPQKLKLGEGIYTYRFSCGEKGAVTVLWAD